MRNYARLLYINMFTLFMMISELVLFRFTRVYLLIHLEIFAIAACKTGYKRISLILMKTIPYQFWSKAKLLSYTKASSTFKIMIVHHNYFSLTLYSQKYWYPQRKYYNDSMGGKITHHTYSFSFPRRMARCLFKKCK